MKKEIKVATLVDEDGIEYELEVVKEFTHKDKNYAVLYEASCQCNYDDDCDDDCDCDCGKEKDIECNCEKEGNIYVLEVVKDKDGNDTYNEIDASLMNEIIPIVEKELYPTEE